MPLDVRLAEQDSVDGDGDVCEGSGMHGASAVAGLCRSAFRDRVVREKGLAIYAAS